MTDAEKIAALQEYIREREALLTAAYRHIKAVEEWYGGADAAMRGSAGRRVHREVTAMDDGELWSFFRRVLDQGRAIAMDEQSGKYPTYEHMSARMDEAARERVRAAVGASAPST